MENTKSEIRTISSLSWEERKAMIEEYLTGPKTKAEVWKKYTGQPREYGQMLQWMRKLGYIEERQQISTRKRQTVTQLPGFLELKKEKNDNTSPEEQQKRIKELERQLEAAQLKAEGYEIMLEIAEKELNIPIRKKSNTK
jgi:transposase